MYGTFPLRVSLEQVGFIGSLLQVPMGDSLIASEALWSLSAFLAVGSRAVK